MGGLPSEGTVLRGPSSSGKAPPANRRRARRSAKGGAKVAMVTEEGERCGSEKKNGGRLAARLFSQRSERNAREQKQNILLLHRPHVFCGGEKKTNKKTP